MLIVINLIYTHKISHDASIFRQHKNKHELSTHFCTMFTIFNSTIRNLNMIDLLAILHKLSQHTKVGVTYDIASFNSFYNFEI